MVSTNTAPVEQPKPFHIRILWTPFVLLGMFLSAAFSAIVIEWIGMAVGFWDMPGSEHSKQTLIQDLSYLNRDFTTSIFALSPTEIAASGAETASRKIVTVIDELDLGQMYVDVMVLFQSLPMQLPGSSPDNPTNEIQSALSTLSEYLDAAVFSIQTVVVRVIVALLTLPAYLLIGVACLLDGLVARDLRKYTAANESAFAYHRFRPWAKRFFVIAWYVYIAWPGPIHPNAVFIPSAALFGIAIYNTGKWFKKFV